MNFPRNPVSLEEVARGFQKIRSGELLDDATLNQVEGSGEFQIKDGGATTAKIADGAVTTAKLADLAVTTAKIANNAVTVSKLLLATNPGLEDSSGLRVKVRDTSLIRDAAGLGVNLAAASGLEIVPGLKAKVDGTTVTINGSGQLVAAGGVASAGFRNKIINGDFRIAQRGTSFAGLVSGMTYTLDRWFYQATNAATVTVTQETDVPTGKAGNSIKMAVTTADNAVAAGDFAMLGQAIEGFDIAHIQRAFTSFRYQFWYKSSKGGPFSVSFRNASGDRSFTVAHSVSGLNTWFLVQNTVTFVDTGTWDSTNGAGLNVTVALMAGTNFHHPSVGNWAVGNYLARTSQLNVLDTIGGTFSLYGFQIEPGSSTTAFEPRPYAAELAMCQRYFEKMNGQMVVNATNSFASFFYKATKRAAPTVTATFGGGTGAVFSAGVDSFYQNANHTVDSAFTAAVDAEL